MPHESNEITNNITLLNNINLLLGFRHLAPLKYTQDEIPLSNKKFLGFVSSIFDMLHLLRAILNWYFRSQIRQIQHHIQPNFHQSQHSQYFHLFLILLSTSYSPAHPLSESVTFSHPGLFVLLQQFGQETFFFVLLVIHS